MIWERVSNTVIPGNITYLNRRVEPYLNKQCTLMSSKIALILVTEEKTSTNIVFFPERCGRIEEI